MTDRLGAEARWQELSTYSREAITLNELSDPLSPEDEAVYAKLAERAERGELHPIPGTEQRR